MTPTNDAPVTVEQGIGWVFWNPDSGEEYSTDHPIRSGECVEAERVRPSTPQEDTLWAAMQEQFQRAERLADLASAPAVDESRAFALVRRIAAREPWQAHYGRTWEDEAADIVAGLPSSAPAGDGVSERDWIMRAFYAEIDRQCSIGAGMAQTCADSGLFQINADIDMHSLAEALARPRAAVGERRNG